MQPVRRRYGPSTTAQHETLIGAEAGEPAGFMVAPCTGCGPMRRGCAGGKGVNGKIRDLAAVDAVSTDRRFADGCGGLKHEDALLPDR